MYVNKPRAEKHTSGTYHRKGRQKKKTAASGEVKSGTIRTYRYEFNAGVTAEPITYTNHMRSEKTQWASVQVSTPGVVVLSCRSNVDTHQRRRRIQYTIHSRFGSLADPLFSALFFFTITASLCEMSTPIQRTPRCATPRQATPSQRPGQDRPAAAISNSSAAAGPCL